MSRTYKKVYRDKWLRPHKMRPYTINQMYKFVPDLGRGLGISKLGKLIAKNANRSLKKAVRQKSKKFIKYEQQFN